MHPRLLKELHNELAKPLEIIFNKSLQERSVPSIWKKAKISAIYKKGDKSSAGNYRPVSLTSIISKVMERILRDHITKHMDTNKLFTNQQYGFRTGRSTALQLLNVLNEWVEALDQGYTVNRVYMDFQKAFDKVPHKRLLKHWRLTESDHTQ